MHPHDLNDDELGAALGASLETRSDAVPTITPGFDGVERRARQITNRRRALAGAAVGALLLVAGLGATTLFADDDPSNTETVVDPERDESDAETPDTAPDDATGPTLDNAETTDTIPAIDGPSAEPVVAALIDGSRFVRLEAVGDAPTEVDLYIAEEGTTITDAIHLADGSSLIELRIGDEAGDRPVLFVAPGADPVELSTYGHLAGGAVIDGIPYAFVGDLPDFRGATETLEFLVGDLLLINLDDFTSRPFVEGAYGFEWAIDQVDVRGGLVLVDSSSDGGTEWTVHDLSGANLDFPMPPEDAQQSFGDPFPMHPRFDRDGDGLVYILNDNDQGWAVDRVNFDGTEPSSTPIFPTDLGDWVALQVETDGITTAVNIIAVDNETGTRTYTETIWFSTSGSEHRVETEVGEVRLVVPAQTSSTTVDPAPTLPQPTVGPVVDTPTTPINTVGNVLHTVIDGAFVEIGGDGSTRVLLDDPEAFDYALAGDGSIIVSRPTTNEVPLSGTGEIVQLIDGTLDGATRELSAEGRLAGLTTIDGRAVAFVSDVPDKPLDDEATSPLRLVDLATGESTILEDDVNGIEWNMSVAEHHEGVILVEILGYGPSWTFLSTEGAELDLASPTDGRFGVGWGDLYQQGLADLPCCVRLSDDGQQIWWLEHPAQDWQHSTDLPATARGMVLATGEELPAVTVPLPSSDNPVRLRMDLSGDQVIVSVIDVDENLETTGIVGAVLVDVTTRATRLLDLPGGPWTFAS